MSDIVLDMMCSLQREEGRNDEPDMAVPRAEDTRHGNQALA